MDIKFLIKQNLKQAFNKCGINIDPIVQFSARPELSDFQNNNIFALAKECKKSPIELGNMVMQHIEPSELYEASFMAPAFINFKLTKKGLSNIANKLVNDKNSGINTNSHNETVVMDYGGANVAKELHIGHLRSPLLGESLARLNKLLGNKVVSDVHLGDWGLQMGLTIAQLEDDGYVEGFFGRGENKEITLNTLNEEYPKASKRKKVDFAFKEKAENYTLKLQKHESPFYDIYKHIKAISVEQIKYNYNQLNCTFDLWLGESDAEPFTDKAIDIFVKHGLVRESEGALIVDVAHEGENVPTDKVDENGDILYKNPMPPVIIKKHNGADVYATTEIATLLMRNEQYHPNKIIYLTDNRQGQHFEQVFRACKLSGISPANQTLIHIPFGTMNGSDGKAFKTRDGETIKLEDIINLIKNKASEKLKQNGIKDNEKLALQIGVAALKFGDMSNMITKNYVFNLDKFTSFEGKTGPYIQYTAVRIKSILNKANFKENKQIEINSIEEAKIIIQILKFIDCLEIAYNENSLHSVCANLYELCAAYSTFYNNVRILNETNEALRNSYLTLSKLVLNVISIGAYVLAFDIPEKM